MTIPVWVEQKADTFTATVIGAPQLSAAGATKQQAVAAVTAQLRDRLTSGEVVLVDMPEPPLPFQQVSPEDAAVLREMCAEIYRERDAQKAAEFPE